MEPTDGVSSEAAESSLATPDVGKLSATAGLGYAYYGGPDPAGYAYWSVGAAYDLAPVSLAVSYVNTTARGPRHCFIMPPRTIVGLGTSYGASSH